jgi:mannose-6-phosphate isomerase-like protein (cupin superfamily)
MQNDGSNPEEENMALPVIKPKQTDISRCIARFKDLHGAAGGFPEDGMPGTERILYNVLGFQPPAGDAISPVGAAAKPHVGHLAAGFGIAYARAKPGNGPFMHNHDTNETFIPLAGRWAFEYEADDGTHRVELDPYDVISFPPGVQRRFENINPAPGDEYGLMMAVIGGNSPQAEYSPEAEALLIDAGRLPAK